jgi:sugar lactone lactonase YvrE
MLRVAVFSKARAWSAPRRYILDPTGKKLGRIVHGFQNTANIAFGGDDWKTVYFCTRMSLGLFKVKIAGVPVPVAKKT